MKLSITSYVYEPPALTITPETDYEAAVLRRYWQTARLETGKASAEEQSANGFAYTIRFIEPPKP